MFVGRYQYFVKVPGIIHLNNEPLKQVTVSQYLDISIDSNLKWDDHMNVILPQISFKIGIVSSLRKIAPIETLKLLYYA